MTIQQLRIFLITSEELNYTRAAERCFISRQALRQNIATLEEELCGLLFENRSNRLSLTAKGELLKREAQPVVDAFSRLEQAMTADIERHKTLRVGVSYALVPSYLPMLDELLGHFSEEYKGISLEISHLNNREVAAALSRKEIDCGLVMDLRSCAPGIERTEITAHPAGILVSEQNPFFTRDEIDISDLEGHRLCAPGAGPEMAVLTEHPDIQVQEIPSFYQAYYMIRQDGAAALDRYWIGDEDDRFVHLARIRGLTICSSFLTRPKENRPEVLHLREFLKAEIQRAFARIENRIL